MQEQDILYVPNWSNTRYRNSIYLDIIHAQNCGRLLTDEDLMNQIKINDCDITLEDFKKELEAKKKNLTLG